MTRRIHPALRLVAVTVLALLGLQVAEAKGCGTSGEGGAQPAAAAVVAGPAAGDEQQTPEWAVKRAAELGGGVRADDVLGPHQVAADLFNPDKQPVRPALGGRIIFHIESQPANLNYAVENSAVCTFILNEIHASLLHFNWETWQQDLELASRMDIEDTLILKGGRGEHSENIKFGTVTEDGDDYVVNSGSPHNPIAATRVPKSEVESVQRGTVFTFELKPGVKWHDGHPFDADDVVFSVELYKNPHVDCEEKRFSFLEIVKSEKLGPLAARFFYKQQYYKATQVFNNTLCILPRHLYDLRDPDNKDYKADATDEEQGAYINDNPHNIDFVGLGPYRLAKWEQDQYLEAVRFDDYFEKDPAKRGYADVLRWRYIKSDDSAFQALLNGEVDITRRITSDNYFGQNTAQPAFTDKYYKAYCYVGNYAYTSWNLYRPKFSDVRVRRALALAFDEPSWIKSFYSGLAVPITGPTFFLDPAYNADVKPLPYDPDQAEELLTEAGWYDRDGDGIVDKDGENLVIEWLMPAGNKASEGYGLKLQESLAKIGVRLEIQPLEFASFLERLLNRDFDAANLAWILPEPENDPKQTWHSSEAARDKRSSNHAGYIDPLSDELIDRLRVELDPAKRLDDWHQLHARIYELQPYLFSHSPPQKYAFNKALHGVKLYNFAPGFKLRDLYYAEGTPGTRPLK